jgi:hypothetical protein
VFCLAIRAIPDANHHNASCLCPFGSVLKSSGIYEIDGVDTLAIPALASFASMAKDAPVIRILPEVFKASNHAGRRLTANIFSSVYSAATFTCEHSLLARRSPNGIGRPDYPRPQKTSSRVEILYSPVKLMKQKWIAPWRAPEIFKT